MARSVRPLLDKAEAALAEARRRIRPNPRDRLTPTARRMVAAWEAERTPDQQYAAWLDGTHILSTADIWDDPEIPENITSQDLAELWNKVRDS